MANKTPIKAGETPGYIIEQFQTGDTVNPNFGGTGKAIADMAGNTGLVLAVNATEDGYDFAAGGGAPGGNDTEIQYNSVGSFAGSANLIWDNSNKVLAIGGATAITSTTPSIIIKNRQEPTRTSIANENFSSDPTSNGWTLGTGWSWDGSKLVATAANGAGGTTTKSFSPTIGAYYELTADVTATAGTVTIKFGGANKIVTNVSVSSAGFGVATSTAGIEITVTNFTGTVDNIVITEVSNPALPVFSAQDDGGNTMYCPIYMPNSSTFAIGSGVGGQYTTAASNTFIGTGAGANTTTGSSNVFFGNQAGILNVTGFRNMFFGDNCGDNNRTGINNLFFGFRCGTANVSGNDNVALGRFANGSNVTGSESVCIGYQSGYNGAATGVWSNNIVVGARSGNNMTTGVTNNTIIGYNLRLPTAGGSNQLVISNMIFGTGCTGTGTTIAGAIGIGMNAPTAVLHLKAGTATANTAPLKFSSGTSLTTAEAGAVEYDGTEFYATTSSASRTILARVLKGSATLDFPSTAAGTSSDLTITVTGAATGDAVFIGVPTGSVPTNGCYSAWVSAANTVTVRYSNNDLTNAMDPASGTYKVSVLK